MTRSDAVSRTSYRLPGSAGRRRGLPLALLVSMLIAAMPQPAQPQEAYGVKEELAWRIERLRSNGSLRLGDQVVPSRDLTLGTYEQRGFEPLWTNRAAAESLLEAVAGVRDDGLDPEDYHRTALARASRRERDPSRVAELDLLRTDALVRLSHDLRFGKTEFGEPTNEAEAGWVFGDTDAVANLADAVAQNRIRKLVDALRPRHFVYQGLVRSLRDLRRIHETGGWETIPGGAVMERDSVDGRVPTLRRRLALEGDFTGELDAADLRFDATLEAAVKSFQHRHGLNEDGIVGSATLAALNVPVERRIDQVRVNLERARWITHELPDTFVAVNIAGARVYLVRRDSVLFETRAIVGKRYAQTPVFTAPMLYVDLNPTWTVPPGIVDEVLGLVRADSGYLEAQRIRVLDASGRVVDPSQVDFSRYTAADFPYVLRQDPGPANVLGQIKLMLPNEHHVYLHDTPAKGLFAQEERLFSHGCIRLEDPLGLAELVLGDPVRWNRETLQAAIDTKLTQTIPLATPVPVFVLYWTAATDLDGTLHLYQDAYDRDTAVLARLDAGGATSGTPDGEYR